MVWLIHCQLPETNLNHSGKIPNACSASRTLVVTTTVNHNVQNSSSPRLSVPMRLLGCLPRGFYLGLERSPHRHEAPAQVPGPAISRFRLQYRIILRTALRRNATGLKHAVSRRTSPSLVQIAGLRSPLSKMHSFEVDWI